MCVCVCYGLRVCGQKYIIIICDRLRKSCTMGEYKHDDVIEWHFMEITPLRNEELVAPLSGTADKSKWPVFLQNASGNPTCRFPTQGLGSNFRFRGSGLELGFIL